MSEENDMLRSSSARRVETWGEIASYLRISVRAAQLWEVNEKLPVRRSGNRVFAYSDELDRWKLARETPQDPKPVSSFLSNSTFILKIVRWPFIAAGLVLAALAGWAISSSLTNRRSRARELPPVIEPRLFSRVSSENGTHRIVPLPDFPELIWGSPDDAEIYVVQERIPKLFVVSTKSWSVSTVDLPMAVESAKASFDGKTVFFGSSSDGLLIYDRAARKVVDSIPTGGPVSDIAISPENGDLYLAMMHRGIRRLRLNGRIWKQITHEGCPYFIDIDSKGRTLLVSYQCGGPGGRNGHDAIELFDLKTEESRFVFSGPPMVGGPPKLSPDGTVAWLNAWDACRTKTYDRDGCPVVPSEILHVFSVADRRLMKTLWFQPREAGGQPLIFPSGSRVLIDGKPMQVIETSRYSALETYALPETDSVVLATDGRRAYARRYRRKELAVIEAEESGCSDLGEGIIHLMAGDGTNNDMVQNAYVSPSLTFSPGVIGQAFALDGHQKSMINSSSGFRFGNGNSTLALYVKPAAHSEGVLLEWINDEKSQGWNLRLDESGNVRLNFLQEDSNPILLRSRELVSVNQWTHIAVTKSDQWIRLFLNGKEAASAPGPGVPFRPGHHSSYRLGWSNTPGLEFVGLLDEIAIWARSLPPSEIENLYNRRTKAPCKP